MGFLRDWVRGIICYLCFVQIIEQILPDGNYRKYVRFFCGLLLLVLVVSPFTDMTGLSDRLRREWRMATLKEDWNSVNLEQEGLEQLRENTIISACIEELERQVGEVAKGNGLENVETNVDFDRENGALKIMRVEISGECRSERQEEVAKAIETELISVYQMDKSCIAINIEGAWEENG